MNIKVTLEYEINGKRVVKTVEATDVHNIPMDILDTQNATSLEEKIAKSLFRAIARSEGP